MRHRRRGRSRPRLASCLVALVLALAMTACTPPNLPAPLSPNTTETAPAPPTRSGVITIGVDRGIRGFNPYVIAQYSPAGQAISALVLPRLFAPGDTGPTAVPTALVDSVEVSTGTPFSVTYRLNQRAAWSDGTPIAAEDFVYLWQQMVSTPGVVSPGGYELITDVRSGNAGKTVTVDFATPFADWRTLFSPLLPARTLKDEPGGFTAALSTNIPVAGGEYRVAGYVPGIGEVTLQRNDKYWAATRTRNTAVFREGTPSELVSALRRGDIQALYSRLDGTAALELASLDGVSARTDPLPATVRLRFATDTGRPTAQLAVRSAIAAALKTPDIRSAVTGSLASGTLVPIAQLSPAAVGAVMHTGTVTDAPNQVKPTLTAAGFTRSALYFAAPATTAGTSSVLAVTLGYNSNLERAEQVARLIQQNAGAVGIVVDLVALTAPDLQSTAVTAPDVILEFVPRTQSDAATGAELSGCTTAVTARATTTTTTTTTGTGSVGADGLTCTPADADLVIAALESGARLGDLDTLLWSRLPVLPLAEPTITLALGPALAGVKAPDDPLGMLWGGALRNLWDWPPPA